MPSYPQVQIISDQFEFLIADKSQVHIIGRVAESDIRIRLEGVSRKHAQLSFSKKRSQWMVKDLGSRHGTVINGRAVIVPTALKDGDELNLGGNLMLVRVLTGEAPKASFLDDIERPTTEMEDLSFLEDEDDVRSEFSTPRKKKLSKKTKGKKKKKRLKAQSPTRAVEDALDEVEETREVDSPRQPAALKEQDDLELEEDFEEFEETVDIPGVKRPEGKAEEDLEEEVDEVDEEVEEEIEEDIEEVELEAVSPEEAAATIEELEDAEDVTEAIETGTQDEVEEDDADEIEEDVKPKISKRKKALKKGARRKKAEAVAEKDGDDDIIEDEEEDVEEDEKPAKRKGKARAERARGGKKGRRGASKDADEDDDADEDKKGRRRKARAEAGERKPRAGRRSYEPPKKSKVPLILGILVVLVVGGLAASIFGFDDPLKLKPLLGLEKKPVGSTDDLMGLDEKDGSSKKEQTVDETLKASDVENKETGSEAAGTKGAEGEESGAKKDDTNSIEPPTGDEPTPETEGAKPTDSGKAGAAKVEEDDMTPAEPPPPLVKDEAEDE